MPIYTPKPLTEAQKSLIDDAKEENNTLGVLHEAWLKSEFYPYVIEIIKNWSDSQDSVKKMSVEALISANDNEIRERMIMAKKIQIEIEDLITKLS